MNENVITIEECRKRAQEASFGAIMKLEANAKLRLAGDDDLKEVPVVFWMMVAVGVGVGIAWVNVRRRRKAEKIA